MDKIAVLDFGGQYAHLIANRVRRLGVYSEIVEPTASLETLAKYRGLIFSGGPRSVYEKSAPTIDPKVFLLDLPVLGVCYGHQLIAHLLKGKVKPGKVKEYGFAKLHIEKPSGIFQNFSKRKTQVWMSHGDTVTKLPPGFKVFGSTEHCKAAAFGDDIHRIYGVQFHVEVTHTPEGMKMLSNFLDVCGCKREWDMTQFLEQELETVKQYVGDRKVFFLVSGGVDSTVAFTLLNRALGPKNVYGLFVDTGFLRKGEGEKVERALRALGLKNFHTVRAAEKFLRAVRGVTDPEEKRKKIGSMFLEVQRSEVRRLKLNPKHWLLGQGTIYPDTIETGGAKHAAKIKTHHNRVPEIEALMKKGLVIEPLKNLYKDEVREVGRKLGLPEEIVSRHPFPGPGLAVRILCLKKGIRLKKHEQTTKQIQQFCRTHGWKKTMVHILSLRSVGVQGDDRTYRHPVLLSAGTAKSHEMVVSAGSAWNAYADLSTALTNRFRDINRVCLSLFPEYVTGFTVHETYLTPKRIKLLQEADNIVMEFIKKHRIDSEIWQFPVVLLPLTLAYGRLSALWPMKGETILLRPIVSTEAMTANFYKMKWSLLWDLVNRLRKLPGVSGVLYDITNKPPGTIEWE